MKSKLIITCVCLGVIGSTLACAGDEEAMTDVGESAGPPSGSGEGEDSEADDDARNEGPSGEGENSEAEDDEGDASPTGENARLTNADCFPTSVPDSAPLTAKLCIDLAKGHPDMEFTSLDYEGMPDDCKPFVNPKCR